MDGLRYGGEAGQSHRVNGAVAGERLVPGDDFNLKLPMKKRYEEVSHNLAYLQAQLDEHGVNAQIQARQLYHDREEVTVHVRRLWAAVGGRRDER